MNRNQINHHYYQANQDQIKSRRKERYQLTKKRQGEQEHQQISKYSQAENYQVLMSFKNYTELDQQRHKIWLDFNWTLQDCGEDIKEGLGNVIIIMKLREVAANLIRDYWKTAKKEIKKSKSWNSLDYDEQQRLIRYWGYEKARTENNLLTTTEQLARQSQAYLQEIAAVKFHEERGKIKCACYSCSQSQRLQNEIKQEQKRKIVEKKTIETESECANCYEYKKVDADSGLCRKCQQESC